MTVKRDDWNTGERRPDIFCRRTCCSGDNHAVDPIPPQGRKLIHLLPDSVLMGEENYGAIPLPRLLLDDLHRLTKENIGYLRQDNANGVRTPDSQCPCHPIGLISQGLDRVRHTFGDFRFDLHTPEKARYG